MQFCSNSVECIGCTYLCICMCVFVCMCTGICVFVFRGEQWGLYRAGLRLGNSSCSSNSNVHCRRSSGSHHHFARTPSLNEAQRITILLQYYFNQWHITSRVTSFVCGFSQSPNFITKNVKCSVRSLTDKKVRQGGQWRRLN